MKRNIVTLKWGTRYGSEYVNRLARSVRKNITGDVDIVCFTDDPQGIDSSIQVFAIPEIELPERAAVTGWRKLCLFRTDIPIEGECLFLDLDLVITGSLDHFFTY